MVGSSMESLFRWFGHGGFDGVVVEFIGEVGARISVGAGFSVGARISVGAGFSDAGMTGGGWESQISSGVHSSSSLKIP